MILAFADDSTVTVLEDTAQANTWCEGVDVEEGVYIFLDERGFMLRPRFTVPNSRRKFLGLIPTIGSGVFTLDRTDERRPELLADVIAGRVLVCPGPTALLIVEMLRACLPEHAGPGDVDL